MGTKYHSGEYESIAAREEAKLFNNKDISQANKEAVKRFLAIYDVTPARKGIFFKQIRQFLTHFKNINNLLERENEKASRDEINSFFQSLKNKYSIATVNTVISVTNRLMTWLNDGVKPYSFRDVKGNKKGAKRDLRPEDMTTLQDREVLLKNCIDNQKKAIISLLLDAGLRRSEITNIQIKDVTFHEGGIANLRVSKSKTGPRDCPIQRSVSHLYRWIEEHPTGKPDDFLFIQTQNNSLKPYHERSMAKLIKRIYARAKIKKPCDITALRHSSNYLDKLDGMSPELSSSRHGHSIEYWEKTYGRLNADDRVKQMRNHLDDHQSMEELSKKCIFCGSVNTSKAKDCYKCHNPLTLEEAMKFKNKAEEYDKLNKRLKLIEKILEKDVGAN